MLNPDLNSFTLTETLAAAGELGLSLSVEEARAVAFLIVTSKFPVCIREHLREHYRRMATQARPG